jgi:preprotein translocase subunit YajC
MSRNFSASGIVSSKFDSSGIFCPNKFKTGGIAGSAVVARMVWIGCVASLCLMGVLSFEVSDAWAQSAPSPNAVESPSFGAVMQKMLPMFAICFAIFYLLVISPQKKEIADHKRLLDGLKKGDNVATSGGLLGRVTAIGEDYVTISLEQNAAVRVERNHIAKKL